MNIIKHQKTLKISIKHKKNKKNKNRNKLWLEPPSEPESPDSETADSWTGDSGIADSGIGESYYFTIFIHYYNTILLYYYIKGVPLLSLRRGREIEDSHLSILSEEGAPLHSL